MGIGIGFCCCQQCCDCLEFGKNILVWGLFYGGLPDMLAGFGANVTTYDTGGTPPLTGQIPDNLDDYSIVFLVNATNNTLFNETDIDRIATWFRSGCKRLVLCAENGSFNISNASFNDLIESVLGSIIISGSLVANGGEPGGPVSSYLGVANPNNHFTANIDSVATAGVGVLENQIDGIMLQTEVIDGSRLVWAAEETIGRSSLVVVADVNWIDADLIDYNEEFVRNLITAPAGGCCCPQVPEDPESAEWVVEISGVGIAEGASGSDTDCCNPMNGIWSGTTAYGPLESTLWRRPKLVWQFSVDEGPYTRHRYYAELLDDATGLAVSGCVNEVILEIYDYGSSSSARVILENGAYQAWYDCSSGSWTFTDHAETNNCNLDSTTISGVYQV